MTVLSPIAPARRIDLIDVAGFAPPLVEVSSDVAVDAALAADEPPVVVFSLSGGKDSIVAAHATMLHLDRIGHPRELRYAIHADLGRAEWRSTPETVEEQARFLDLRLIVVRRAQGDMVSTWEQRYDDGLDLYRELRLVIHRGPWSSASQRFCTSAQKRDQIVKELASLFPGRTVLSVIGIRRDESVARRSKKVSSFERKMMRADGTVGINWNSIIEASTPDVFAYASLHGLPMHEAYSVYGNTRVSCALCVLSSLPDLRASLDCRDNHPLYSTLVDIELRTGFSFQQKTWLADLRPDLHDRDVAARLLAAKGFATERRSLEKAIGKGILASSDEDPWPQRSPSSEEALAISEARRLVQSWTGKEIPYVTTGSIIDRIAELHALRRPRTQRKKPS